MDINDLVAPARPDSTTICTLVPNDARVIAACYALLEATSWRKFESSYGEGVKRGLHSPAEAIDSLSLLLEMKWEPTLRREVVGRRRARAVPRFEFANQIDVTMPYGPKGYGAMATAAVLLYTLDAFERKHEPDAGWGEAWAGMLRDAIKRIFVAYRGVLDPYLVTEGLDPDQVILKPMLVGTPITIINGRMRYGNQCLVIEVFPNAPEYVALADPTEALFAQTEMDRAGV